jgi:hypothetical protein
MAWTLQLLNDDTTLSLNDGSAYSGRPGFLAPPPPVRVAQGGANLFRHGSDIRERVYGNRSVTVTLRIHGTSQDNLIANILAVNNLLERAAEYTTTGLGSQVKLRRKWENASNQVDFHVLTGSLALGDEFGAVHSQNTTFADAILQLTCKPFAYGAEETIENYVADPGFEVAGTALANWTSSHSGSANGTSARDTSVKKDGNGSLKLVMTSSGDGEVIQRQQQLNDVDAGQVWSFQCWVRVDALSDCKVVMELDFSHGTDVEVATTTVNASSFVKLTANNNTVPGSTTHVILKLRLEATDASATGTVYIDNVVAVKAAAVPVAWASSRDIANSGADDEQASVNYIDILDVPGDVPAELQVRILETTAHDEFWAGARHAGRMYDDLWLEGEDGTGVTIRNVAQVTETPGATNSDAAYSDGAARESQLLITGTVTLNTVETWFRHDFTIATPPSGQFRVLIGAFAKNGEGHSTTLTLNADDFQFGVGYTYGAFNLLNLTDPDATSFVGLPTEAMAANTTSNRTILDLGTVTIPPVATPDNQTAASFVLSIFEHFDNVGLSSTHLSQEWEWDLDFVMLMPVDFGANYVSKTSATDVVLLDSMSDTKGLYLLNTSDVVQSFPSNQLGRSPEVHPDGTRVYMLAQTTTDYTVGLQSTVSITYRPRFLHVMGV